MNRPDRRELARDLTLPEDMDYNDDEADGDSSHRLLDRRLNAQKNAEAEALAAQFDNQYKNSKYSSQGAEEWAPKALLMPGVNDPSIWGIKCRVSLFISLLLWLQRKVYGRPNWRSFCIPYYSLEGNVNSSSHFLVKLPPSPPPTMPFLFESSPPLTVTRLKVTFTSKPVKKVTSAQQLLVSSVSTPTLTTESS